MEIELVIKICTVFLSSYRNTSERLGEQEMLWEEVTETRVNVWEN